MVYNPIALLRVAADRPQTLHRVLGLAADVPLVGTACRIAGQKNPPAFTRVLVEVLRRVPRAHAVVMGEASDAALYAQLEGIVRAGGVADRFHFTGYRPDAPQLVRELDCFVMTSHWEGLPTSLLEAMNADVPVAFMEGAGGLVDLALLNRRSPFALVAPKGAVEEMAEGIAALLADPVRARTLAAAAKRTLAAHFTVETAARRLSLVYRHVLKESA